MKLSFCRRLKLIDGGGDALRAGGFMSLEELELEFMSDLEGWSSLSRSQRRLLTRAPPVSQSSLPSSPLSSSHQQAVADEAAKQLFPCLKILSLHECPKLTSIPLPSSVESVNLTWCNQSVLGQLNNLPQLSHLKIFGFYKLKCFPQGMLLNLTALQNLEIVNCWEAEALPKGLMNLTAIEKLDIINCYKLEALPEGLMNLSSLRSLHIGRCFYLKQLPKMNKSCLVDLEISDCRELEFNMEEDFQHLVALQRLTLKSLPKLARFPEGIKQAVTLKKLSIVNCSKEVMDLPEWIGTLTSLESLTIEGCKNRKVLPEGMQHLTALRKLEIDGCDTELERRCKKDTGEDWSNIAHVKEVQIDTGENWSHMNFCGSSFTGEDWWFSSPEVSGGLLWRIALRGLLWRIARDFYAGFNALFDSVRNFLAPKVHQK